MKRKVLVLFLIIVLPFVLFMSSCRTKTYVCGDFSYSVIKKNKTKMAAIRCLSDEGLEKENVVIPEYLDGYKVYGLYDKGSSIQWGHIRSTKINRLYILSDIKLNKKVSAQKIFYMYEWKKSFLGYGYHNEYYSSNISLTDYEITWNVNVYNANVSYYVDDEIYWIDDYDNEIIKYIPEEPKKEGYTFDGWYKDIEYNNKWDFDNDIVAAKEYDADNNYVYHETKLYAKFI